MNTFKAEVKRASNNQGFEMEIENTSTDQTLSNVHIQNVPIPFTPSQMPDAPHREIRFDIIEKLAPLERRSLPHKTWYCQPEGWKEDTGGNDLLMFLTNKVRHPHSCKLEIKFSCSGKEKWESVTLEREFKISAKPDQSSK
jgi:hypothetical protein